MLTRANQRPTTNHKPLSERLNTMSPEKEFGDFDIKSIRKHKKILEPELHQKALQVVELQKKAEAAAAAEASAIAEAALAIPEHSFR